MTGTHFLRIGRWIAVAAIAALTWGTTAVSPAWADEHGKPYTITDGVVDWYTFSGFRRYHAECHVCHGPDGLGSSFAPALVESLKVLSYDDFIEVVVNGRENVSSSVTRVMPSLGANPNVACFMDDIYAYLKARSDGALGRGRPKKERKPAEATERENDCLDS